MPLSFVARILRPVNSYYISLKRVDWKIKERLASTKLNHIFQMRYCNALFSLTYIYIYICNFSLSHSGCGYNRKRTNRSRAELHISGLIGTASHSLMQ